MAEAWLHRVSVDESQDATDGGTMFKAFCETCDWSGEHWHHADEYADSETVHPDELAWEAANIDAGTHQRETGEIR